MFGFLVNKKIFFLRRSLHPDFCSLRGVNQQSGTAEKGLRQLQPQTVEHVIHHYLQNRPQEG